MSEMMIEPQPKNRALAGCLTLLIPGLGQMYNGQGLKGLVLVGGLIFLVYASTQGGILGNLGGLAILAYYVAVLVDAVVIAGKLTEGRGKVGPFDFF